MPKISICRWQPSSFQLSYVKTEISITLRHGWGKEAKTAREGWICFTSYNIWLKSCSVQCPFCIYFDETRDIAGPHGGHQVKAFYLSFLETFRLNDFFFFNLAYGRH